MTDTLLDELCDWLRIPSISSGGGDPADLQRAAEWACERIVAAGGSGEVLSGYGNPLCAGELRSRRADAPTVLIYGHYDVQSPDPRSLWTSDPFDPVVRDGRLYARGASDDKGNFLPLLHVACELARSGELPVHVRVLLEGEEEVGGTDVLRYIDEDERGADCAIVFDGGMIDEQRPALHIAVRGVIVGARARAHRRARPPLGRLRRRGTERAARAHEDARRRSSPAPTAGCATSCAPACARRAPTRSPPGPRCPRAPDSPRGRRARARSRRAPPPSCTRAPGRTRASTSTASRAATPCSGARSSRAPRARA